MLLSKWTSKEDQKAQRKQTGLTITTSEYTDKYLNERMRLSYYKSATIDHGYLDTQSPIKPDSGASRKKQGSAGVKTALLDSTTRATTTTETIPFSYIGQGYDFVIVQSEQLDSAEGGNSVSPQQDLRKVKKKKKKSSNNVNKDNSQTKKTKRNSGESQVTNQQRTGSNPGMDTTTCSSTLNNTSSPKIDDKNDKIDETEIEFDKHDQSSGKEGKPKQVKSGSTQSLSQVDVNDPKLDGAKLFDDYLQGSVSSDGVDSDDSSEESDADNAIKLKEQNGNISDDSVDVRKANYRESKQRAKLQTSDNFKRVTQKNREIRREMVRNKNDIYYASYSQDLVINKDKPEVQDLFRHSEYREDKLKKLECLKKAKFDLIQQENEIFQAKLNEKDIKKKPKKKPEKDNMQIVINDNYFEQEFKIQKEIDELNQDIEKKEKETQKKIEDREIKTLKEKFSKQFIQMIGSTMCGDVTRTDTKQQKRLESQIREQQIQQNSLSSIQTISEREWRKLVGMYNTIDDFDPLSIVSTERIKKSIIFGIPDSLRGEIWCLLCQVKKTKASHSEDIYFKLVDLENPEDEHRIQKDVTRTFTNYPVTSTEEDDKDTSWNSKKAEDQLFNILLAYANYDTQVGYVQGLNYIAAMLLMHIQDEEKVFWCLVFILNRNQWRSIYMEDMPKLMEIIDILDDRLQKDYPHISKHLDDQDFTIGAAFSPLFITLYIYQIEHGYAMRIFEYFILDGEQALMNILWRILDLKGDKICDLIEMELIQYLRTDIINECIEDHGVGNLFI